MGHYCLHVLSFFFILIILLCFSTRLSTASDCTLNDSDPYKVAYTITVDQSGHGNFTTIQAAIDSIPFQNSQWIRIQIFSGKYQEKVTIPKDKSCLYLEGAGSKSTSIEWSDHEKTDISATFTSFPDNIVAKGITFANTYQRPGLELNKIDLIQAVAAIIYGDKSAFYHCTFLGLQDTLYDKRGRHYFHECYIEGAVDFIFGDAQSIYEKCAINLNIGTYAPEHSHGYITAQKRESSDDPSGFVFKSCSVSGFGKAYLGRAWGPYSRVIFYQSVFSDVVVPAGWNAWGFPNQEGNFTYVEADCSGQGADTSQRVPWMKKLSDSELNQFVDISYVDQEGWIAKLPQTS